MATNPDFYFGDKDQFLVMTPYGKGLITKTRHPSQKEKLEDASDDSASLPMPPMKEIRLLEWENAKKSSQVTKSRRSTTLYSTTEFDSIPAKKGDDVVTPYGRGTITEFVNVRLRNTGKFDPVTNEPLPETQLTKFHVTLNDWRLAGRSRVKCYLFSNQVKVVRKKTLLEMNAVERVEFALRQKQGATKAFSEKKYREALNIYAGCIEAVRYIQHDMHSNNECRADLVEVMVTCSNNAATCGVQLEMWDEVQKYAKNAYILMTALFKKRGSRIHSILVKDNGHCDSKLFGEWRVKSHLLLARALAEKEEYDDALEQLKMAREIIAYYTVGEGLIDDAAAKSSALRLRSQEREILKLKAKSSERKKAILKKEKARAQAMFGKNDSTKSTTAKQNVERQEVKQTQQAPPSPIGHQHENGVVKSVGTDDTSGAVKPQSSSDKNVDSKDSVKKRRVSFSSKLEEKHEYVEEEEEVEEWYDEHKEALILLVIGGIACATFFLGRAKK